MNSCDLKGQVAVVTGGAQGIGHAVATRLHASGALVGLVVACWKTGRIAKARRHGEALRASAPGLSILAYLQDAPETTAAWRQDVEDAFRAVGVPE